MLSTEKRGRVALTTDPTASGIEVQMQEQPTRQKLTRLRPGFDGSRYFHPNGYVIERERRGWSERGRPTGRHHDPPPPLYRWWVYFHIAKRRSMIEGKPARFLERLSENPDNRPRNFDTLAEARAWCDTNPRDGWLPFPRKEQS